jgi:hypothetical protein
MNRREAIQRVALLMGGAISGPALLGVLNGCTPKKAAEAKSLFLSAEQLALVAEVAEITIPRTNTPGAKDVGIPAFIDLMLKDAYPKADQERYLDGLAAFEAQARQQHSRGFLQLEPAQQTALVRSTTEAALAAEAANTGPAALPRPFVLMTREMTLLGYFVSQPGATQVLQYNPMPGPFRGCVPLKEAGNGKTFATEQVQRF